MNEPNDKVLWSSACDYSYDIAVHLAPDHILNRQIQMKEANGDLSVADILDYIGRPENSVIRNPRVIAGFITTEDGQPAAIFRAVEPLDNRKRLETDRGGVEVRTTVRNVSGEAVAVQKSNL